MATKLLQSPLTGSHIFPSLSISILFLNAHRPPSTYPHPWRENNNNKRRLAISENQDNYFGTRSTISCLPTKAVPEQRSSEQMEIQSADDNSSVGQVKAKLYDSFEGINRGIFGVTSAKKTEIERLVKLLESKNPTLEPTRQLQKEKAVNVIKFSARGFDMLSGQLQINASFQTTTKSRVEISYDGSSITPEQLMSLFRKNYDLLLNIFNPDGWLEITYVDETLRIGRDNKGNTFIVERLSEDDEQASMQ